MRRPPARAAFLASALVALGLAASTPARAGLAEVGGHATLGYTKLFATEAPGGSISVSAGLDHPVFENLSVGADVGFHLLGSRNETAGSLFATVDYSVFEVALLAHWTPAGMGPLGRVSVGPALISARAELSTSGGGAAFSALAIEEVSPGLAVEATLMPTRPMPVRVGLQLAMHLGYLPQETWNLMSARLAFHY
jgi:hypothetical protein